MSITNAQRDEINRGDLNTLAQVIRDIGFGTVLQSLQLGAGAPLDQTNGDILPLGPAALAGASGLAADAAHVHQLDKTALRMKVFTGVDASGGASHVAIAALKAGDQVVAIVNLTDDTDGSGAFEGTITVNGQLQQPATDLSAKKFVGLFVAKS